MAGANLSLVRSYLLASLGSLAPPSLALGLSGLLLALGSLVSSSLALGLSGLLLALGSLAPPPGSGGSLAPPPGSGQSGSFLLGAIGILPSAILLMPPAEGGLQYGRCQNQLN